MFALTYFSCVCLPDDKIVALSAKMQQKLLASFFDGLPKSGRHVCNDERAKTPANQIA
jgi:hypothetical protein